MAGPKASPAGTAGSQDVIEDGPGSDIGAVDRQTGDFGAAQPGTALYSYPGSDVRLALRRH
jgi:hypothetical protein